jgi:hypothetical protein
MGYDLCVLFVRCSLLSVSDAVYRGRVVAWLRFNRFFFFSHKRALTLFALSCQRAHPFAAEDQPVGTEDSRSPQEVALFLM